ncbi:hypothetical protein [Rhodococcus zopfii]|uniref:hypothetical protein n=1 Tax=Rhodococcus zopfii TaxID=43772 RepID=UPI000AEF4BA2|nr:hypothetical protein [Rhodococcus zopfii]
MTTHSYSPAAVAHIEIAPTELAHITGAVIVGDHDGRIQVTGTVEPSHVMPGMVSVETEAGTLYLDAELPVTIVNPTIQTREDRDDIEGLAHTVGLLKAS